MLSGLMKCIDPLGTSFKLTEYFRAFGWEMMMPWSKELALLLCLGELALGVFLFFGHLKKWSYPIALLFLLGVTGLTLYSALKDPVSDCGCFGDALQLSNWTTFIKNVVLILLFLPLLIRGRNVEPLLEQWVDQKDFYRYFTYVMALGAGICWWGIAHLPLIDFRPFKSGVNIPEAMSGGYNPEYEETYSILYEKDGVRQEFSLDEIPDEDSGWTFVEQVVHRVPIDGVESVEPVQSALSTILGKLGIQLPKKEIKDFFVTDIAHNDLTQTLLRSRNYSLIAVSYALDETSDASIEALNTVYNYAEHYGYAFYCLTPIDHAQYRRWVERAGATFPFIYGDVTVLETITRANPGLLLIKDGTIYWKKNLMDVNLDQLQSDKLENQTLGKVVVINYSTRLWMILALIVIPYLLLWFYRVFQSWDRKRHDVTAVDE